MSQNNRFTAHFGAHEENAKSSVSRTSMRSSKTFAKYFEKTNIESVDDSTQQMHKVEKRDLSSGRKSLTLPSH